MGTGGSGGSGGATASGGSGAGGTAAGGGTGGVTASGGSGTGGGAGSGGSGTGGASGGAAGAGTGGAPAMDAGAGTDVRTDGGTPGADAAADAPTDRAAGADAPRDVPATPDAVPSDGPSGDLAGWRLVWADEFNVDGPPSSANWVFENGFQRNMELQWYQPGNATVTGGFLVIEGRRETKPNPNYQAGSSDWKRSRQNIEYTASSLTTSGKHTFMYGRFEMRARIDTRAGSWPAFWTLGSGAGWPQGGEIDIMEFYANNVLANVCLPMGSTCGWSSIRTPLSRLGGATFTAAFHVWVMEWDAQKIDLYLDDVLVNHFLVADAVPAGQTNPYNSRSVYILVNQAIGGTNGGDPSSTAFPLRFEVDYVRVYQR